MVSVLSPPIHGALSGKAVAALTCLSAGLLAAILLVPDRLAARGDDSLTDRQTLAADLQHAFVAYWRSGESEYPPELARVGVVSSEPNSHRPDVTGVEIFGGIEKRAVRIVEYDPAWPDAYEHHSERIRAALGPAALQIEHIGSTSVPGLAAKPVLDILVVVADITAEEDYLAHLVDAGFSLRRREPGHRMLRTADRNVHVHVLSTGNQSVDDYILFRDRLRADVADRDLYERTKRALATQDWPDMNAYAEAKTEVIAAIKGRARTPGQYA